MSGAADVPSSRFGEVGGVWFHIGMPKAASTSLQYLLSRSLPDFERRDWGLDDINQSVHSPEELNECLTCDWTGKPRSAGYAASAFRNGEKFLVSSEGYFHFPAHALRGTGLTGLAIVRSPSQWVSAGIAQKVLFELPAGENLLDFPIFGLPSDDSEAHLRASTGVLTAQYRNGLACIRSWLDVAAWFDLVPYSPDIDVRRVVSTSLGRLGIALSGEHPAPRLRSSYPLSVAQLAMTIALIAVEEFGVSQSEAVRMGQRALTVDAALLGQHSVAPSASTRLSVTEELLRAHEEYAALLRDSAPGVVPDNFAPPDLRVIDPAFATDLARSLIREPLRRVLLPPNFDAGTYLEMNHDVAFEAALTKCPFRFAVDHFANHGVFEGRPAPVLAGPG